MTKRSGSVFLPSATTRREALQAGAIGLLGLSVAEVSAIRELAGAETKSSASSVIFIFLTGGLSQQDSFDLKPDAPESVRGEFRPIATKTPGVEICEHLPMLAALSDRFALVRSRLRIILRISRRAMRLPAIASW